MKISSRSPPTIGKDMYFSPNTYEKPLNPADIADIEEAELHFQVKKSKIFDRAWYICNIIAKHFNLKINKDCEYEPFDLNEFNDYQDTDDLLCLHFIHPFIAPGVVKIIHDKKEIELVDQWHNVNFPAKWLYCDFEPELIEGINLQKKKEEEKELKLKARKKGYQIKSKIVARLKKTMTPEEIQIVFGKEVPDED